MTTLSLPPAVRLALGVALRLPAQFSAVSPLLALLWLLGFQAPAPLRVVFIAAGLLGLALSTLADAARPADPGRGPR